MGIFDEFRKEKRLIKVVTRLSSIGLTFVFCIMIGFGIGLWVDRRFGTNPWGEVVFFALVLLQAYGLCSKRLKEG